MRGMVTLFTSKTDASTSGKSDRKRLLDFPWTRDCSHSIPLVWLQSSQFHGDEFFDVTYFCNCFLSISGSFL